MKGHFTALAALLFVASCWGVSFVVTKEALRTISPEAFMFYRFALATLALLPLAWSGGRLSRRSLRDGIVLGLLVFVGYWLQTRGLLYTTPARSSFLTGLGVVVVPLLEGAIFRTRISLAAMLGTIAAVAGTSVLFGPGGGGINRGDVMTIICAAGWSLHVVLAARYSERTPPGALACLQVAVVAFGSLPMIFTAPIRLPEGFALFAIIGLAVVNTALAFLLLMWGQARVTATEAAIVLAFEPVAAAIASVALGIDRLGTELLVGGGLIVAGMVVSQLQPMKK